MNGLPKESKEIIDWGIRKYKEYLSENLETRNLESELFTKITSKVASRKYFTKPEVRKILSWRRPTTPNFIEKNTESRINSITREALVSKNEEIKVHTMTLLHGVGVTSASKLLMVSDPNTYAPLNKVNWVILSRWQYLGETFSDTPHDWLTFSNIISKITNKHTITGRELDQSLVALYLKYGLNELEVSHIPLDHFFK